jgi:predicted transcriptional regulator
MTNIRQEIAIQLDAYEDIQALKSAIWEWVNQVESTLPTVELRPLERILASYQTVDVEYSEADWLRLEAMEFWFDSDAATLEGDRRRLAHYRETGEGVDHDRVAAWLSSIGTETELPCPN